MKNEPNNRAVFLITIGDLQSESLQLIGRRLIESELNTAIKEINSGLSFGINDICKTAIEDAIEINHR